MKKLFPLIGGILLLAGCHRNGNGYDASGVFEATEVIVSAEANGKLLRFGVEEGQQVTAHTELGYIDTLSLYLNKLQLQANRRAVGSRSLDVNEQIAATQEQIAKQLTERERTERLIAAGAGNQKDLDDINSNIAVLEKQLAAQRASLISSNNSISGESSAAGLQVAQVEDQIRKSVVSSPISGTILVKYAEEGEFVSTGKPLFKVADIEEMTLRAYITSGQLTQIQIGQGVTVLADYGDKGSREYPGTVTWVADKAEFTPKTIQTRDERANLVYAVKIRVKNDGYIKIGMYGDVKLGPNEPSR